MRMRFNTVFRNDQFTSMTEEHQTSPSPAKDDVEPQAPRLPVIPGSSTEQPLPDPLQFTVLLGQLAAAADAAS